MITANQLRAARALLNIDQRQTAELADLSVPTIQRMEASDGVIRGNVDSLMKLIGALDALGIVLIGEDAATNGGGPGVRGRSAKPQQTSSSPNRRFPDARRRCRNAHRLFQGRRYGPVPQ